MSLSLLQPLALGLLGLLALPVLAHLTRQRPTERVAYGAMLLLRRLAKRLRRRRRVQDPWLLLLRALALLLVLLAAAGPELVWTAEPSELEGAGRVVVVVDRSMSMSLVDRGGPLFARARADASALVRGLPEGARVGLVTVDAAPGVLVGELTDDRALVQGALDRLEPTADVGDLGAALLEARRLLGGEPGEVVLFTDEAGPAMIPAAQDEIARLIDTGSALLPRPVHAEPPRNVTVVAAEHGDGLEGGQVAFRVASFGPDPAEVPCEVVLPDGATIPVFVEVPAYGEALARVTVPREARGGVGRVTCEDVDLPLDDTRWFHLPPIGASRVLLVDGDPGDTPTRSEVYFLAAALAPASGLKTGALPEVVGVQGLARLEPSVHGAVFVANVPDPRPLAPALRAFVAAGGTLVLSLGDNAVPERYNAAFGSLLPAPLRAVEALADRAEPPQRLAMPDPSHELFEPFRRTGRTAFTRVGSWRAVSLEPYAEGSGVTTLLSYEGGVPALVERRVGKGRVVLWTSSVDLAWSNLPLQAVFLPLVQRLVRRTDGEGGLGVVRADGTVGRRVAVELPDGVAEVELTNPDGAVVRAGSEAGVLSFVPDRAGPWRVGLPDGGVVALVAVNLDPIESDVRRTGSVAKAEAELRPERFVKRADLGGPAQLGALLLLAAAALLALRPRRAAAEEEGP